MTISAFTMEDGGQSDEATITTIFAAAVLREISRENFDLPIQDVKLLPTPAMQCSHGKPDGFDIALNCC